LAAEGLLDDGELAQLLAVERGLDPDSFGVEAALATGAFEQRAQLGLGERRSRSGGGCRGHDCTGFRAW